MKRKVLGLVCLLVGLAIAVVAAAPMVGQLDLILHWPRRDPDVDLSYPVPLVRAAFLLLIGWGVAYLLVRVGLGLGTRRGRNG